jgi:hypothetical protein
MMQENNENKPVKQVPRPEIKISGKNTILTYHLGSFYDLYLAISQINGMLSNISTRRDSFTIKRDIKMESDGEEGPGSGIILRITIPRRINDMSLIGTAISSSQSISK